MQKKGASRPIMIALIEIIIGVLIVLALIPLTSLLYKTLFSPELECTNEADWDNIKEILVKMDGGEQSAEIPFFNSNCNLVSFSTQYSSTEIVPEDVKITDKPQLCIGKVSTIGYLTPQFKKYKCYTLYNLNQVNAEQLSTHKYNDYIFLTFERDGSILRITPKGTLREESEFLYPKTTNEVPEFDKAYVSVLQSSQENLKSQELKAEIKPAPSSFPIPSPSLNSNPGIYFTVTITANGEEIDYSKITLFTLQIDFKESYIKSLPENAKLYAYAKLPKSVDISALKKLDYGSLKIADESSAKIKLSNQLLKEKLKSGRVYAIEGKNLFAKNWAVSYKNE